MIGLEKKRFEKLDLILSDFFEALFEMKTEFEEGELDPVKALETYERYALGHKAERDFFRGVNSIDTTYVRVSAIKMYHRRWKEGERVLDAQLILQKGNDKRIFGVELKSKLFVVPEFKGSFCNLKCLVSFPKYQIEGEKRFCENNGFEGLLLGIDLRKNVFARGVRQFFNRVLSREEKDYEKVLESVNIIIRSNKAENVNYITDVIPYMVDQDFDYLISGIEESWKLKHRPDSYEGFYLFGLSDDIVKEAKHGRSYYIHLGDRETVSNSLFIFFPKTLMEEKGEKRHMAYFNMDKIFKRLQD